MCKLTSNGLTASAPMRNVRAGVDLPTSRRSSQGAPIQGAPRLAWPLLLPLRPNAYFVGVQAAASLAVAHRDLITDSDEVGENDLTGLRGRGSGGAHGDD